MGSWLKSAGLRASVGLAAVASSLELETIRTLIIAKRQFDGSVNYLEILPKPLIESVSQQMAKAYRQAGQTEVEVGDYLAYVSRSYPISDIAGDAVTYLIDATSEQHPPTGGMVALLVPERVLEGDENFWHLILREQV